MRLSEPISRAPGHAISHGRRRRLAALMLDALEANAKLVGDNEPYSVGDELTGAESGMEHSGLTSLSSVDGNLQFVFVNWGNVCSRHPQGPTGRLPIPEVNCDD